MWDVWDWVTFLACRGPSSSLLTFGLCSRGFCLFTLWIGWGSFGLAVNFTLMSFGSAFIIVAWWLILLGCQLALLVRSFGRYAVFRLIRYFHIYYADYIDSADYIDYADYIDSTD